MLTNHWAKQGFVVTTSVVSLFFAEHYVGGGGNDKSGADN